MRGSSHTRHARRSLATVPRVRYPGGSYGDGFHWQTNTVSGGGYVAPGTDFDSFMGTVHAAGAQPIIIANYGSGTPTEAAGWVRYANVTKSYGAKYREIGNEVHGNGLYGASWELDNHTSKTTTTTNVGIAVTETHAGRSPDYGIQMVATLAGAGDTLVPATSPTSLLSAQAVKRATGDVNVLLINDRVHLPHVRAAARRQARRLGAAGRHTPTCCGTGRGTTPRTPTRPASRSTAPVAHWAENRR